jgi:hypothetical protein
MIQLDDPRWKELEGGYRMPYDASIALKQLERAKTSHEINAIFSELWNELHHQGDVGLASYFSIPHIIRIAKDKSLYNYNVFALITTIEIERHKDNPKLPKDFEEAYLRSLRVDLPELIDIGLKENWDLTLSSTILSALAVSKGHLELADAISKMEDEELTKEFLENF